MKADPRDATRGARRSAVLGSLMILLLTVVTYLPALHNGFIWDDDDHLTANPAMTAPGGLCQIWSSLARSRYYPLTLTSFWVQRRLWGLNPLPYHAVNVVLHAANAALVFLLLRRLRVPGAWMAAAWWAVHPVNVESVAWVTELKNTQSGLFYLLTILGFVKWRAAGARSGAVYALILLCAALAMLSKTSTVMLPVVLVLCIWWQDRRWRWRDAISLAPVAALSAAAGVWTILEQRFNSRAVGREWSLTVAERLIVAGKAVWFYLGKLSWPHPLVFIYPRWSLEASHPASYFPLLVLMVIGVVLWCFRRGWARPGWFAFTYFVVSLFPVLGFFNVYFFRFSFVGDHFQYLASIAPLALAAACITAVADRAGRARPWLSPALCGAVLLLSGVLSWQQTLVYRSNETLWRDTLAKNPGSWLAHNNLGIVLQNQGRIDDAMAEFESALQLKPDYAEAHNNVGTIFAARGKAENAADEFATAVRLKPSFANAHENLARLLAESGKSAEAVAEYEAALRANPDSVEMHNDLGIVLVNLGRIDEAIVEYRMALRLKPDAADIHWNLANALATQGKLDDAAAEYRWELRIKPDEPVVVNNLAVTLMRAGRIAEAVQSAEQLCKMTDYQRADALALLAAAYAEAGRFPDAVRCAQRAAELARANGQQELAVRIQEQLKLYQEGRPFHEKPPLPPRP